MLQRQPALEKQQVLERQQEKREKQQEQEKEKRERLVSELRGLLKTYVKDRNTHYYAKDLFIPGDKEARDQFIKEIDNEENGLLKAYVESGRNEDVLKKITTEMDKFPGVKMQATLSKIVVKLMDADATLEDLEALPGKTVQVLVAFEAKGDRQQEYALKIRDLYQKIAGINTYAETLPAHEKEIINKLVDDLKKDVDQFVCQNPEEIPGKEAYQKFKMKVKARLHSQDDVMSEHASWPEIVANLLFSIVTILDFGLQKTK